MSDAPLSRSARVGLLAPTGRDGALAASVLARFGIDTSVQRTMADIVRDVVNGDIGAIVIAEEALVSDARRLLVDELERQPSWSDLPVVVLTAEGELSRSISEGIEDLSERGNVTLLERPVRIATLVTTLRSALRARARQYDVRDHLLELNSARADAEEANRAKFEFLAMMSHELRTPLNAIGGYAEIIEMGVHGPITDDQRDDLARIKRSQRHLLGLINGVLNFARLERGNIEYRVAPVRMSDLFGAVELLVAPQASARGLRLDFEACDGTLVALGDAEKVQQIMLNLVGNAIKFTSEGGRVSMSCDCSNDRVEVVIADTGVGIPAERLQSIFEPFVQLNSGLTRTQDGVGLGLAISRDLARGMGGDLTAESEVGVGSRFTLTLRLATEEQGAARSAARRSDAESVA